MSSHQLVTSKLNSHLLLLCLRTICLKDIFCLQNQPFHVCLDLHFLVLLQLFLLEIVFFLFPCRVFLLQFFLLLQLFLGNLSTELFGPGQTAHHINTSILFVKPLSDLNNLRQMVLIWHKQRNIHSKVLKFGRYL